jgi:uncharacterized spore protein YtfJ
MNFERIARQVAQAIEQTAHTKAVFGEPVQLGEKVIVPVAVVVASLGGGGGVTRLLGAGGGGGLAIRVLPIGFISEQGDHVTFSPIEVPEEVLRVIDTVDASSPEKVSIWSRIYERARGGGKHEGE